MSNNNDLLRYAGLATQFFIVIAVSLYAGFKLDEWLLIKMPLLVWLLPLLFIVYSIYKIVKETGKKN